MRLRRRNNIIFIAGLHKSGTSVLHRILSDSDLISGFHKTGVIEDEGQHLQDVYLPAWVYGGPGKFAFAKEARLDETSELIRRRNRKRLIRSWSEHWDVSKPFLVEKSPPNLIRTRFLQGFFPDAFFITIIRHPLPVSLATQKWSETSLESLIEHWILAYNIYREDSKHLKHKLFISYEEMLGNPDGVFERISEYLGVKVGPKERLRESNQKYFKIWKESQAPESDNIIGKYEDMVKALGYSLKDLEQFPSLDELNP